MRKLAARYIIDILSAHDYPWPVQVWKKYIEGNIFCYYLFRFLQSASERKSLKWVDIALYKKGVPHPVWKASIYNMVQTKRAATRARLLTESQALTPFKVHYTKFNSKPKVCLQFEKEE